MTTKKTIIAFGDGGLNSQNPLIDLYILAQTNLDAPRVLFLPTASFDSRFAIEHFLEVFGQYPCHPNYLSLLQLNVKDVEDYVLGQDCIYVGGGHTRGMLALWKEYGLDLILKKAYDQGVILAGGSAGSVCWFKQCITDSTPGDLTVMSCLGYLPMSNCPHYFSDERRTAYKKYIASNEIVAGYANCEGAALHFENGELLRSVSAFKRSQTYHLSLVDGVCQTKTLPIIHLGKEEHQQIHIWGHQPFSSLQ